MVWHVIASLCQYHYLCDISLICYVLQDASDGPSASQLLKLSRQVHTLQQEFRRNMHAVHFQNDGLLNQVMQLKDVHGLDSESVSKIRQLHSVVEMQYRSQAGMASLHPRLVECMSLPPTMLLGLMFFCDSRTG